MNFRSRTARPALRSAVALSVLLALGACSSDDDDGDGTLEPGGETNGGDEVPDMLTVALSPDQEVPPVTDVGEASGTADLTVDETTGAISGSVTVSDLTGPAQMAHIHRGFRGSNGPVLIGLEPADAADPTTTNVTVWNVPAGATLDEAGRAAYARGELYFNVHTANNSGGEVRGQILPTDVAPTFFTVRIENVSTTETLPGTLDGENTTVAVPLSPGAYIVHREESNPLIEPRDPASSALEMLAEDGDPSGYDVQTAENNGGIPGAAVFNTPVDATEPGPIGPGGAYEFVVSGVPGDKLSIATMFIQSNDWFYTTSDEDDDSLALFSDDGTPLTGDQSDSFTVWDAGTEQDELPLLTDNQPPRQTAPNTGESENGTVASLASQGRTSGATTPIAVLTVTPATDAPAGDN